LFGAQRKLVPLAIPLSINAKSHFQRIEESGGVPQGAFSGPLDESRERSLRQIRPICRFEIGQVSRLRIDGELGCV